MSVTNYQMKSEIENIFKLGWTQSPIQYHFEPFNTPSDSKWISLEYFSIERTSSTGGRKYLESLLRVRCYDRTGTLSVKLQDEVNAFFDCYQGSTFYSGTGSSDGLGIQSLDNGIYESTGTFSITSSS